MTAIIEKTQVVTIDNNTIQVVTVGTQGAAGVGVPSGGEAGQVLAKVDAENYNTEWVTVAGTGTVTSVAMTVPTGLSVAGTPITSAGTLAVTLASGYVIPTQATLDGKQGTITLTTTGSSGAATLIGNTLNIPQYSGGSGSVAWGAITGTLSNQTDLQNALNAKQNTITTGTTAQYFQGDLSLATFPTAVSSFTNDAGYITASSTSTLTNKSGNISQWTNDSGYLTSASLTGYVPYTGATSNVDLGTYDLITDTITSKSSAGLILENNTGGDVLHIGSGGGVNATAYGGWNFDNVTASRAAQFGASKTLESSSVTNTELGYLSGVTSAIQTQIDSKQATITGAATTITTSNLTASRALESDGSGKVAVSSVTSTELGYVGGVTSAIQTQLDAKTLASVVPNTAPTAGQILVGNAGNTAYAKQTISGSGATITLGATGVLTISSIANASLANSAITIAGTSTSLGGAITQDTITGLSTTGLVKRTGTNTLAIATAGTDYQAPITLTTTGTSGAATFTANTLNIPQYTGGGGSSPLTTKGDLYGYSTADARVPVGTDGYALSADSTASTGVSYINLGGVVVLGYISSNTDYTGTSSAYTVEPAALTITIPSTGKWAIKVHINNYLTTTGITTDYRIAMGTAAISGSTGYPTGFGYAQGGTGLNNSKITTGSPTVISGPSKSSGENALVLIGDHVLDVSTSGTIKVQMSIAGTTANVLKLLAGSYIRAEKIA
jgi:hypothetical protein